MEADPFLLSKKESTLESRSSALRTMDPCNQLPTQADLLQRVSVGKGLTAQLAPSPAPVAGNSWWVLYRAAELSSQKEVLANTRPARDKKRWVNSGNRFHEQTGGTMLAQQEQKGDPLPLNSSPQKSPAQKEEGPFASGNPINCFRKWKSVQANGAVIDGWFSLRRPSGDKVNSNVI